ncbi:MAG TPA: Hpt domain-containing protein [Steroidobacteraceae bacterium]|nr:Hpt domain-containing protein [Steroidobacteraceae bacterium]
MPEIASQTVEFVGRELNVALAEARSALEAYVEQPQNLSLLERCTRELHQVLGVLRVLEIYGGALLAEEMEQVARYLVATADERKSQAEALDALMRAMAQLPSYLERVLAGGRDLALVLLPLLNDLRAVRGSALLSEGTLLLLNLKSDREAQPAAAEPGEPVLTVEQWARRLRARFQVGLIGWIRGERLDENLEVLASVAQKLEQIATRQPVFQLWWVVGAVLEALRDEGLEGGVSVKRLLGLADREIKRLYEQTEARYAESPPVELLNNLLYYVSRANASGPRVTAVRASFRLAELLPVDESVEQERESLSAPSVKLMQTVAAAIREDLARVKDVLDIFVRRGAGQIDELAPQVQLLRKIGDTLGVLGLGELRASVQRETERLEQIVAGRAKPDEATLVEIAATLIGVEDRLDDRLVGMILPRASSSAGGEDADADFREVQAAVLRECILNLARLKESIAQSVGGTLDAAGLDGWHELMRGLKAGLLMLGKTRAVELTEALHARLRPVMQPGGVALAGSGLDRLADAIVSLEYYMETLQAGRSDPWYMLDNAQSCLQALDELPAPMVPTVAPLDHGRAASSESPAAGLGTAFAETVALRPVLRELQQPVAPALETRAAEAAHAATTAQPPMVQPGASPQPVGMPPTLAARHTSGALAEHADPELVKLFIEEAREELEKITKQFPIWDQNPLEQNALATVRRSFHTLKGSGRMVGARDLAELAWAIENLLNRLLDNTLARTPAIVGTVREALAALPQLIEQLETGAPPAVDFASIVTRAHSLAAGRGPGALADGDSEELSSLAAAPVGAARPEARSPGGSAPPAGATAGLDRSRVAAASTVAEQRAPARASGESETPRSSAAIAGEAESAHRVVEAGEIDEAEPTGSSAATQRGDEALREIYARETAAHIAVVRSFLARAAGRPAPHELPEEVYRACHTLSGSSKMAEARHGVRLAQPLDHWLRKAFDSGVGLLETDLTLIAECMSAMEAVAAHLDESTAYFVSHASLYERIAAAEKGLDRRIADSVEAAAATGEHRAPAQAPESQPEGLGSTPASAGEPPVDFDPDVASIFTEEATELIEAAESALGAWRAEPASGERLAALKRPLHTLKGGARMAGIIAMGDLSHELETLVNQLDSGAAPRNDSTFDALQASLDTLANMRDNVAAGRGVAPARELIARLRALARPGAGEQEPERERQREREQETSPAPRESAGSEPDAGGPHAAPAPERPAAQPPLAPRLEPARVTADQVTADRETPARPASAGEPAFDETEPQLARASALDAAQQRGAPALDREPQTLGAESSPGAAEESWSAPLPVPPGREPVAPSDRPEMARVDAELLDQLLNIAGEVSISRARLEQQLGSIDFNLGELSRTVTRLKEQLRKLEIETEKQILHRHEDESGHRSEFDPLELDRYSTIQQFSRALAETASDVASIQQLLETMTQDTQNLLQLQARTVTELQNGLMRTRMVPFQRHVPRLARIVRQAAADTGKRAELTVEGAAGELDRQVIERMTPAFEHMLRNAVVHGIEPAEERAARGKPETGTIRLALQREGAEVMVRISDDGAGMNLQAIRSKGVALGLLEPGQTISDEDAMQLVLEPGFSTAGTVTQQAGRGVGMDVVATEIKRLGGALHMESRAGEGTQFTIRLPFTLAISHALVVRTGDEYYALPLPTVEGVLRLNKAEVGAHLGRDAPSFEHSGQRYRFQHLATFVGLEPSQLPEGDLTVPVVLVRAGDHSTGLVADELVGSREIVVKSVGPQISSIRGISGATILGDGRIVIILDIGALVRGEWRGRGPQTASRERGDRRTFALVVDDSITVRRVTQRLLERNGMRVLTARDGMDAVSILQENVPDIILLDIEMPRMDGYEVAAHVRGDPRLKNVPIIMITSRVGEKHRARAIELGVDDYLGKPYQEAQLLDAIAPLVERHRHSRADRRQAELDAAAAS